jgi:hypothetical protein
MCTGVARGAIDIYRDKPDGSVKSYRQLPESVRLNKVKFKFQYINALLEIRG